jgi:hypothetical protein
VEILSGFVKFGTVPIATAPGSTPLPGENVDNIFVSLFEGRGLPPVDFTLIAFIAGLAAIAGSGGLTNTPISNYTRDQGWGMGHRVGAIPSVFGGRGLSLSHVGSVFQVNRESLPRWRRWYRHVVRDQMVVWMPACFIGLALPAMLSVQFLPFGTQTDDWSMSVMTAGGVREAVTQGAGLTVGNVAWFMTIFCGFLVLAPTISTTADGIIRRWVDVFWTSSPRMRRMDTAAIKGVYFKVLLAYAVFGVIMLSLSPGTLVTYATMFYNIALGVSCWHTLAVNVTLLPPALRPGWFARVGLVLAGLFFFALGMIVVTDRLGLLR